MASMPRVAPGGHKSCLGGRKTQTNSCPCHPAHPPPAPSPAQVLNLHLLFQLTKLRNTGRGELLWVFGGKRLGEAGGGGGGVA